MEMTYGHETERFGRTDSRWPGRMSPLARLAILLFGTLLTTAALDGCADFRLNEPGQGIFWSEEKGPFHANTEVYPISEKDALAVMRAAMAENFREDVIRDLESPRLGYAVCYGSFGPTRKTNCRMGVITVEAIPTPGREPDGTRVDGFLFSLYCTEDALNSRMIKVSEDIVSEADQLAVQLPHVRE